MNSIVPMVTFDDDQSRNAVVLTIASPARNSVTQLYPARVQVSGASVEDIDRKLTQKLELHQIDQIHTSFSIGYANDRTEVSESIKHFRTQDRKVDLLTNVLTLKWSFVFDSSGHGEDQLHSVVIRISERPNAGMVFQRLASGHTEDMDSLDGEMFAPVFCKVDFLENRFSSELLAVVTEWVSALPRAEPTFGVIPWLWRRSESIVDLVNGTFPSIAMIGALGIWMAYLPEWMTSSIKVAVAWMMLSGVVFLFARYIALHLGRMFERHLGRICAVPIFQITAGDSNRMTKYLAKSHKSMFALAVAGLAYGVFEAIGVFLGGVLVARFFS